MFTSLLPLEMPGYYGGPGGPMMGHHGYGSPVFGGFFMLIGPLLLLALLLLLLLLYKRAQRRGTPLFGRTFQGHHQGGPGHPHAHQHGPFAGPAPEDEALRTLANRLAAGDISPEDYRARIDTLRSTKDQTTDPTTGMPYAGPEANPGSPEGGPTA
ncbi:Uncharacterized membrane protein [Raineyella antarctica]|uniref:Uncharacterized membrane protein n=1 Tax=Raineyella antarctica TaxID=1577474 RepID=A0A1G6H672_9ACTN|nr:hypothetical protein [Raineyella antarctica]SDB89780.1 Uncharacterized membrane protein [Raineyella antarctica]